MGIHPQGRQKMLVRPQIIAHLHRGITGIHVPKRIVGQKRKDTTDDLATFLHLSLESQSLGQ